MYQPDVCIHVVRMFKITHGLSAHMMTIEGLAHFLRESIFEISKTLTPYYPVILFLGTNSTKYGLCFMYKDIHISTIYNKEESERNLNMQQ